MEQTHARSKHRQNCYPRELCGSSEPFSAAVPQLQNSPAKKRSSVPPPTFVEGLLALKKGSPAPFRTIPSPSSSKNSKSPFATHYKVLAISAHLPLIMKAYYPLHSSPYLWFSINIHSWKSTRSMLRLLNTEHGISECPHVSIYFITLEFLKAFPPTAPAELLQIPLKAYCGLSKWFLKLLRAAF